jgi:ABC-type multidrug transport system ATPase subunit
MFTIPLAATGALWLLVFTGTSLLNAYTLTGFLILLGVVVNNGIILIDYSLILRRRGFRYSRALMTAGQARVRPILITTITTIVAMIPLAMGRSEETSLVGAPFAITIIGGLSLSALFTLIFIPVVFSGLRKSLNWITSRALWLKLLQLGLFILSCVYIYTNVDNIIWKVIFLLSSVMLIPSAAWFVSNSLKRAKSKYIKADEPIVIRLRNLTKIYDHPSKFAREWNKGKLRRQNEETKEHNTKSRFDFGALFWQLPLLAFMIYFVYFYTHNSFWLFALSIPVHLFIIFIWQQAMEYIETAEKSRKISPSSSDGAGIENPGNQSKTVKITGIVIFWFIPLFNLVIFFFSFDSITSVIFIAIAWYAVLVIYRISKRLHEKQVNVARITGRFSGLRRLIYRFAQNVPLIGKRKKPFRALFEVSLEIEKGMFGLLGPNGAGKTTLMRIICGILDQSYGKITINGFNTLEKREELQGLIGYLPQEFGLYENMTPVEFLNYQAILKGITDSDKRKEVVQRVLLAVHIEERKRDKISTFSGGMKQRIGIAQILLHMPRILVVDEPTAGLDPRERIRFRNLLMELSRDRVVIFSTHIIEDISSSCNKVAVLERGKLRYLGKPSDMTAAASGKVWQFKVPAEEFNEINRKFKVIYHMRDGERIKVRCLSESSPFPEAIEVKPTLEDSYLWLLRKEERIERA